MAINRHALRQDTGALVHLARLPAPLVAHHTRLPDGTKAFEYGTIITSLATQTDERLRERARFLQYAAPHRPELLTRALVAPEVLQRRAPNEAERLAGAWLLAEIAASRPTHASRLISPAEALVLPAAPASGGPALTTLRAQMTRQDYLARLNGEPPAPAYLSAADLRDLLIHPPTGATVTPLRQVPATARPASLTYNEAHELPLAAPQRNHGPLPSAPMPPFLAPPPR